MFQARVRDVERTAGEGFTRGVKLEGIGAFVGRNAKLDFQNDSLSLIFLILFN